jgi:hypothetical protein
MDVVRSDPRGRQAIQRIAPSPHQSRHGKLEQEPDSDEQVQSDQQSEQRPSSNTESNR